ncbi:hypothetical protein NX059_009995 [Plenodomus lindquistii]|nr:hypothetical protein NX059_009995 [Plenodomus lindquistii]
MHLNKEQKKLVYAQENKAKLEAEPVEVTLGDVTLPLEPLNRNHLPDRFKSLRDIVRQSETPEDWENVVRLLEGFQSAGLQPKPQWQELVVRQLGDAGMQHLVLKALQRVKATGLRLTDHDVVAQVLKCIHDKAAKANWDQEETTKALRMAKQVTELMEDKEHHGAQPDTDHRRDPVVIALPTELAAVLAQKHGGDKAEVKKLANRLVAALKQSKYLTKLDSLAEVLSRRKSEPKHANMITSHFSTAKQTAKLMIIWNALKTSRTALGAEMPMADEAKTFESRVQQVLDQGVDVLDEKLKDGQKKPMYDYAKDALERCRLV